MLLWFNVHLISMAVYRGGGSEVCVLLLSALLEPLFSSVLFYTGENMQKSQWQVKSKISYDALGCISNQNKTYRAACFWVKRGTVFIYMPAARVEMFLVFQSSLILSSLIAAPNKLIFASVLRLGRLCAFDATCTDHLIDQRSLLSK